jgi:hypothetical protein
VGRALIRVCAILLTGSCVAHAQVQLPECESPAIDMSLLRELAEVELDGTSLEVIVGAALCDPSASSFEIAVRELPAGVDHHASLTVPEGLSAAARARLLALAIAERARLEASNRPGTELAEDHAAPMPVVIVEPEPVIVEPPHLPPSVGASMRLRIAPRVPSFAIGARADIRAHFDSSWSLRGEVFGSGIPGARDTYAIVAGGAIGIGLTLYREPSFELSTALRAEVGILQFPSLGSGLGWGALGLELGLVYWIDPGIGISFDLGASAVLFGGELGSMVQFAFLFTSQTEAPVLSMAWATVDFGAGVRFPF